MPVDRPSRARRAALLATLVLAALALAAPLPVRGDRSISFMAWGDPAELTAWSSLVESFRTAQPGIDVELIQVADQSDYRQRLGADLAAGTPADVVLVNYRRMAGFAWRGLLLPLADRLRASEMMDEGAFWPGLLDAYRWRGTLQCIPQNIASLVVYYNRDLLRAAGIADPADDWTWDDLLAMAKALTADTDGDGRTDHFGLGVEPSLMRVAPFVWQHGGEVVNDPLRPNRLGLEGSLAREAVEWFVALQTVHHVVPDAVEEAAEPSEDRFLRGTTALFLNSRRGVPTYRAAAGFDWDVAPLPRDATAANVLHSDGFCIPAATRDADAAWAFVEHATTPEAQAVVAGTGRTVPSLRAVAESDAFLDPSLAPARSRVWLDAIPTIRTFPILPGWVDIEELADEEIERAFYGQVSVEEAIRQAAERTAPFFLAGGDA